MAGSDGSPASHPKQISNLPVASPAPVGWSVQHRLPCPRQSISAPKKSIAVATAIDFGTEKSIAVATAINFSTLKSIAVAAAIDFGNLKSIPPVVVVAVAGIK